MNIRPSIESDKPAIIELLKKSLGDATVPKSEGLWCYKHEHNPFGPSFVLIAEDKGLLVGLRAFMQWQWRWKGKMYRAIRAVDTATHPNYQGKGIFKKLTLQQLEICRQQGVHFVFNTPNEQSRPGYLKMGWVQQGKMPIKIKVLRPLSMIQSKLFAQKNTTSEDPSPKQLWNEQVLRIVDNHQSETSQLATALTPQYIRWRYPDNPLLRYVYFTDSQHYLLIGRIKVHSFARELRLTDLIISDTNGPLKGARKDAKERTLDFCKQHAIDFISLSGQQFQANQHFFNWMGVLPVRAIGPIVTLRNLNADSFFDELLQTRNWNYSIGDMELF